MACTDPLPTALDILRPCGGGVLWQCMHTAFCYIPQEYFLYFAHFYQTACVGDELFTDTFKIEEVDDVFYKVTGKVNLGGSVCGGRGGGVRGCSCEVWQQPVYSEDYSGLARGVLAT